jgi:hypothetical protein
MTTKSVVAARGPTTLSRLQRARTVVDHALDGRLTIDEGRRISPAVGKQLSDIGAHARGLSVRIVPYIDLGLNEGGGRLYIAIPKHQTNSLTQDAPPPTPEEAVIVASLRNLGRIDGVAVWGGVVTLELVHDAQLRGELPRNDLPVAVQR